MIKEEHAVTAMSVIGRSGEQEGSSNSNWCEQALIPCVRDTQGVVLRKQMACMPMLRPSSVIPSS